VKRQWTAEELAEHWTLHPDDLTLLTNKAAATRLGSALLLKYFQYEGRFPQHRGDIPPAAIVHVAQQLGIPPELLIQYDWNGRTIEFHRAQIRQALGFSRVNRPGYRGPDCVAWTGSAPARASSGTAAGGRLHALQDHPT